MGRLSDALVAHLAVNASRGGGFGNEAGGGDQVAAVGTGIGETLNVLADMADAELFQPLGLGLGFISGVHRVRGCG